MPDPPAVATETNSQEQELEVTNQGDGYVVSGKAPRGLATHYSAVPMHALIADESVLRLAAGFLRTGTAVSAVTAPPADRAGVERQKVTSPPEVVFRRRATWCC